ncbi:MAG: hypothetical protein SFW08_06510 [Gemmatimonadaceae bacterium]|nr:hypothetical protein [Gemmatimonadaceae bacterium]
MDTRLRRAVSIALVVHLMSAGLLLLRVLPALELRVSALPLMQGSLSGLLVLVALIPSVPAVLVGWLAWPAATTTSDADDTAITLWATGLAAAVLDAVARTAAAWWQPLPSTIGELMLLVLVPVDAVGRVATLLGAPLSRWAAPVGSLGVAAAVAAACFAASAAVVQRRRGRVVASFAGAGCVAAALVVVAIFRTAPLVTDLWIRVT